MQFLNIPAKAGSHLSGIQQAGDGRWMVPCAGMMTEGNC